jgi:hypothetical protein
MQELSETYKDIIFIKVDVQKCEDIDDINSILSVHSLVLIDVL